MTLNPRLKKSDKLLNILNRNPMILEADPKVMPPKFQPSPHLRANWSPRPRTRFPSGFFLWSSLCMYFTGKIQAAVCGTYKCSKTALLFFRYGILWRSWRATWIACSPTPPLLSWPPARALKSRISCHRSILTIVKRKPVQTSSKLRPRQV